MKAPKKDKRVSVSLAKAKFLSLIREVERGQRIELTKDGRVVAQMVPAEDVHSVPAVGFGGVTILGDVKESLPDEWTLDQGNLKRK